MRRLPLVLPLVLAACTVGPDYQRPAVSGALGGWIGRTDAAPIDPAPWARLNDRVLSSLIDDALAANLDVQEAVARLGEARALRDAAAGRALPQVDATGSAQQQQVSRNGQLPAANIPGFDRNYSLFDLGFDASWEIDLWGATRRSIEASGGQVEAADARARDVRLQVVAEVARTYAQLRGAQASLASAREDAETQAGIARLVRQRYQAGEAARFDDARAESQARTVAAAIPGFEADIRAATYSLATLTGRPPEALLTLLDAARPMPSPPENVALGLRSDVLRRRPDVRAAEADLAAATANVGVATADLFPRFSLTGSFGQQAREPGNLGSSDSTRFQIGPSFRWPIFDAGRVRANIRAADARADQAAARYTKAVLSALADSETAINRYTAAQAIVKDREAAASGSATSLDLARQRYRAGEDDLLTLLDTQSAYTEADRAAVQARQQALIDYVAVVKALGGGLNE
ncbi:NodT family efflux transporter outer membrane factor (OMF) lipoprotein [Sphingomonas sp. UYAg733]